jgi:hypothetical protein
MAQRRKSPPSPDLNETFERLALQIGDRIGESLARALDRPAEVAGLAPASKPHCEREGCDRPVVAKGLCKSHYNLMLYHRRKAEAAAVGRPTKRRRG